MIADVKYLEKRSIPSDIFEHLPTLLKYGLECDHIVELGVRGIVSTWAFLSARPLSLLCVDQIDPIHAGGNWLIVQAAAEELGVDCNFIQANDLEITLPETDLLFIDTWHVEEQLRAELNLHAPKARKYIIMHDTVTFGETGESQGHRGLQYALNDFLNSEEGAHWRVKVVFTNNNGLTVLERVL